MQKPLRLFSLGPSTRVLALLWVQVPLALTAGSYSIDNPHPDLTKTADGRWTLHDMDRPWPEKVDPLPAAALRDRASAPSDAVVLFDGEDLSAWNVPDFWQIRDGVIVIEPGERNLSTKDSFGSMHLHLEWKSPAQSDRTGQNRGNSGVFLMGRYEIQVLDTYENRTYADGMGAALYGAKPPAVNALRPSGEWQFYDIWFQRPQFAPDGAVLRPARVSVMVNGVLVHDRQAFEGPSSHRKRRPYAAHPDKLPLMLQYHNETVRFRNVWLRELPDDQVFDSIPK